MKARQLWCTGLLAAVATFGLATPAFAHNVLVGSSPTPGATLRTGPSQVRLDFNAPVQDGPNFITVIGPGNTHWEKSEQATVEGNSVSTTVVPLGPAGQYTIGYRIISADGHPVSGSVAFTLLKAGNGIPVTTHSMTSSTQNSTGGGGIPLWVWIVAAAVVAAVGVIIALRWSGKSGMEGQTGNQDD